MDLGLANKVVVVTGGTSGIGLASVRQFLREGCKVALCSRSSENVRNTIDALAKEFDEKNIHAQASDVLDADTMNDFARHVLDRLGPADILINNAGQGRVSKFADTSDQDWRDELDLKFFSQINPIRAFEKQLNDSNSAAITAVNSLLAYQPEPHMVCTAAARAGVQNLLKSLAGEFAPNIRVNSVLIGVVVSGQWELRFENRKQKDLDRNAWYQQQASNKKIPLQRFGEAEEVANAIAFLSSPAASYITGAQLELSGGLSRYI